MNAPVRDATARHERFLLAALTSTMVLLVLDSSIVGVMLPSMTEDLGLTAPQGAWVVSAYLLTLAAFLPLGGRLSDAFGALTLFRTGMAGFVVASIGIAAIPDFAGVVGCRAAAGVAAAMLMPATLSLLMHSIREERRAGAMAVYTGVGQGFAIVGPTIGGVCAQFAGWQWGFLVNVPVGLAGLLLVGLVRPANPRTPVAQWDLGGLVLLVAGLTLTMTALLQAPAWGWGSAALLISLVTGLILLAAFAWHALRTPSPILDVRLFARADFSINTIALASLGFAMTVATIFGATALQDALHLEPAEAGVTLLPLVVPLLITTRSVASRYTTLGLRRVVVLGALAFAVGLGIVAVGFAASSLVVVGIGMIPAGAGIGAIMSPLTAASIGAAPQDKRGQASGLVTTCRQVGGVIGIAVFSACATAIHGTGGVAFGFALTAALMAVTALLAFRGLPAD